MCRQGAPHIRWTTAQLGTSPVRGLLCLLCTSGGLLRLALCHLHRTVGSAGLRLQLLVFLNDCACVQDELFGITLQEQGSSGHAPAVRPHEDAQCAEVQSTVQKGSCYLQALELAWTAAHSPVLDAASVWRPSPSPVFAPAPLESRQHTGRWTP